MTKTFFNQLAENNSKTYDNILKIATGQGDDYMTSCLLYCNYFNKYYKVMTIDLSKQEELDADTKVTQQN